jgi:hypothetical protein
MIASAPLSNADSAIFCERERSSLVRSARVSPPSLELCVNREVYRPLGGQADDEQCAGMHHRAVVAPELLERCLWLARIGRLRRTGT